MSRLDVAFTSPLIQAFSDNNSFELVMDSDDRVVGEKGIYVNNDGIEDYLSDEDIFYMVPKLSSDDLNVLR